MSRESFPELPEMPEELAEIPVGVLAAMIAKTIFAISTEESRFTLNGALLILKSNGMIMVATDGHRLAMVESDSELPAIGDVYRALLPRKAMGEIVKLAGDSGADAMVQFSGDENHLFFQFGDRLLLSRKLTGNFPGFRARAAEGSSALGGRWTAMNCAAPLSAWRSFPTSVRGPFGCGSSRAKCRFILRSRKPARAKRALPVEYTRANRSRSASMRSICSIFCGRFRRSRWRFISRIRTAPASCGRRGGRRAGIQVSLCGHADAHLTRL